MLGTPIHVWVIFGAAIIAALALDLGVLHRRAHAIQLKEALIESAAWISVALLFNLWLYFSRGPLAGVEFFTAYLVEKSLSVDNIFVFLLIFQAFRIPPKSQHRVLYFGIAGALVLRAVFVLAGITLLQAFHPIMYIFGTILLFTGLKMLLPRKRTLHPENNWMVRVARRMIPVVRDYEGQQFLVRESGKWKATPLFLALVAVEAMDIIFAVDSVPSDANVPSAAAIRQLLEAKYSALKNWISEQSPEGMNRMVSAGKNKTRSIGETIIVLAWHEAHHQGQAHLTFNMYKAAQEKG